jgi:replicative DNA helicase
MTLNWERAVLGTVLFDASTMAEAELLRPSDFTGDHQLIWSEMLSLSRREALEEVALVESLRSANLLESIDGGEEYVRTLVSYRGMAISEYVARVVSAAIRRELRQVAALIRADAEDENISITEAVDEAERRILQLRRNHSQDDATSMADIIQVFNTRVDGYRAGTIIPSWVPHLSSIRDIIGYVDSDDFVIIASRPGEGKSSLMRFEFLHAALRGKPVLLFNLENGELEYAKFAISLVTGIDSEKLKNPRRLSEAELSQVREASEALARLPLYVKTMGSPSAQEVRRISQQHVARHNVGLIGVDYIQLIRNGIMKRVEDVTESSGVLRGIALNLNVPVVAAAQMSREIVHRGADAEPELSDLRESGSLEQDATMVWFNRKVWAREPGIDEKRRFPQNINPDNNQLYPVIKAQPVRTHVLKNRNGAVGVTDPYLWVMSTNSFMPLTSLNDRR